MYRASEAATVSSREQPVFWRFYSDWPLLQPRVRTSMAKVKLGSKEFDVNAEEIYANSCGVSAADLALFAARVKTGEISIVKMLYLVIFFRFCSAIYFPPLCVALRQR